MKKRKLIISVAAIIVVLAFLLSLIASVFPTSAATLSQQLAEAQNQKKAAERQLSDVQAQKKTTRDDISALDSEISALKTKISAVQGEIDSTTALLAAKTEELNAAEEACDRQFDSEHCSLGPTNETPVFMRVCGVAVHFFAFKKSKKTTQISKGGRYLS